MGTRLILVRHCEAEGNFRRLFQGSTDAPVSEKGRVQLDLLSVRCRNMAIDRIYTSPLRRARETAEAVNRYHHLPVEVRDGLREIDGGEMENQPWEDFPRLYPEQAAHWNKEPWLFCPPGGEPMRHVYDRIWNTILEIMRENPGRTVCAASHGCAIRNFLCRASGWPIERLNEMDWCDNTGLSIVDFDGDLRPHIVLMNDASHLTGDTSTFATQDWWKPENRGGDVFG